MSGNIYKRDEPESHICPECGVWDCPGYETCAENEVDKLKRERDQLSAIAQNARNDADEYMAERDEARKVAYSLFKEAYTGKPFCLDDLHVLADKNMWLKPWTIK